MNGNNSTDDNDTHHHQRHNHNDDKLSKLDEVMREHIGYLVLKEGRPFSFHDFLNFEVDGLRYHMSGGTFRNKVSALVKKGEVEVAYYSSIAFYTIKGVNFTKQMTPDDNNEEGTANAESNEASAINHNEDLTDTKKKVLVSHITMPFEALRRDMEAVFRITKDIGKIFFKVSINLEEQVAEIELCGITQQKGVTMTSMAKAN